MILARRSIAGTITSSLLVTLMLLGIVVVGSMQPNERVLDDAKLARFRFSGMENCLMRKVNGARRRNGRAALSRDKQLGYVARIHSNRMARSTSIWHDNVTDKVTRWRRIGQNVGRGGGCKRLFRAFMRSYSHRKNILGRWRFMGVANEWCNGRVYVHMIFESRRDPGNVWHYP